MKFSLLMSVYFKEKPVFLAEALDSVFNQSLQADQIVLVCDGPLTEELDEILECFLNVHDNFEVHRLPVNNGLQFALNFGLQKCKYDLIARMDSDDICRVDRFETQVSEFRANRRLAIVGSDIEEFIDDENIIVSKKHMPEILEEIKKYSKLRNPFNHPTVMYKKDIVSQLGGYRDVDLFEDYDLWLRMLKLDVDAINISEPLVKMRTVDDIYRRRGGFDYVKKIRKFRKMSCNENQISLPTYSYIISVQTVASIVPNFVRKFIYRKILRKN